MKEMPKFGYFFSVACLDAKHHSQLPTLTALVQSIHLHLIQHSFNGQAMEDTETQLSQEPTQLSVQQCRVFVGPVLQIRLPGLLYKSTILWDRLPSRARLLFLQVLAQSQEEAYAMASLREL